ncbi:MAG: biopolymer transporter ExbD [Gammaproteobacteria bacterium]|nr:biopolymer transporter ExbD [Gammaproteobacteria bacterium]
MKRIDTINVIPFIDIMLVLLAIVLTTATFISRGVIEVDYPESAATAGAAPEDSFEISITADGLLYVGAAVRTAEELGAELDAMAAATPVVLGVDREAPFGSFFGVVDLPAPARHGQPVRRHPARSRRRSGAGAGRVTEKPIDIRLLEILDPLIQRNYTARLFLRGGLWRPPAVGKMAHGPDESLRRSVGLVIRCQLALAALLVAGTLAWSQVPSAPAAVFGAAVGISGTLASARMAGRVAGGDGQASRSLASLYLGEIQKLLIAAAGVAFGLVVLELPALFLILGLVLSQFGYLMASVVSLAVDR